MAAGPWTYLDTAPPTNIDLRDIERFRFTDGVSAAEVVGYFYDLRNRFNGGSMNNKAVQFILDHCCASKTTEQMIEFHNGTITWNDYTEFGVEQWQRITKAGSVVVPREKTGELAMTWKAMRKTKSDDYVALAERWLDGAVSAMRKDFLDAVGIVTTARAHPAGNGSVSPGWIGGGSQNYIPPDKDGVSFSSDDHIDDNQADSAAGRLAAFTAMRDNLWEHGYFSEPGAPIILLHGTATLADVKAVSGYTARKMDFVTYAPGSTTNYAELPPEDLSVFHGVWEPGGVWCCQIGGIPDDYYYMLKSFGRRHPKNPVRHWVPGDIGDMELMNLDLSPPENVSPFQTLKGLVSWGFGIQDPAAGAVSLINGGGVYTDPTNT